MTSNSALSATSTCDPVLRARAAQGAQFLAEVAELSPRRPVVVPWAPTVPVGAAALRALSRL